MAGNRQTEGPVEAPDRLSAQRRGGAAGGGPAAHPLIGLQRSAGNRATTALVTRAAAQSAATQPAVATEQPAASEQSVQRFIGGWLKKKFGKKKPGISGPTGGRTMTKDEQGGVPSMKDILEEHERSKKGSDGGAGGGNTPPPTVDEGEEEEGAEGGGEATKEEAPSGGSAPPEEPPKQKTVEEQAKEDDERLFEDIKKTAAILKDPNKTSPGDQNALDTMYKAVVSAADLWKASPRRMLNDPGDKPKYREIEALLQELKWTRDKTKADGAALEPDPQLLSKDQTGYFVSTAVDLHEILPDGNSMAENPVHLRSDRTFETLDEVEIGGWAGYKATLGGKAYWLAKNQVVIKHGKFDKVAGPLFAKDPSADDVKQTTLGDCYLQASLASLAERNPGFIKAMMRDNGDDSVTVRLYKVDETDPANHKYAEQYVRVEKSVPKGTQGQDVYNAGALWVRLAEKAYAAGGFTGTGAAAPTVKSYAGIASGFTRYAMEVLTGAAAQQYWLTGGGGPEKADNDVYFTRGLSTGNKGGSPTTALTKVTVPWDVDEVNNHPNAKTTDNYKNLLSFKILNDKAKVDTWIAFVKTDAIKNMFVARKNDQKAGYAGDITLKDFDDLFKSKSLDATVAAPILAWIEQQKLYPGVLGTAKYSQTQLDVFSKIKETLERGGSVTGGTWKYPGKTTSGTGASGGEAMSHGMVGGHAFSVIGYRASSGQDPTAPAAGDFYFVKIRNPWGNYGRKYDFSKGADAGEEVKDGDGVSWLELSDVTRFFETVTFQ